MSTPVHPFVILCFGGTGLALTVLYGFELTSWKLRVCLTGSSENILALRRTNGNSAVEDSGVQFFFSSRTALTRSNLQVNNSGSGRAPSLSLLIQKALAGHHPTVQFIGANNQNDAHVSALVGPDKITTKITGRGPATYDWKLPGHPRSGAFFGYVADERLRSNNTSADGDSF